MKDEDVFEKYKDLPKTHKEAIDNSEKFYFTGNPCKQGHYSLRYANNRSCVQCKSEWSKSDKGRKSSKRWRDNNREHKRKSGRKHYQENRQTYIDRANRYYIENREKRLAQIKEYYEMHKEYKSHYKKTWAENNKDVISRLSAKRKAAVLQRTLKFSDDSLAELNDFCISEIYKDCQDKTDEMNMEYNVDHIIPLQGSTVSGLHVWYNLQVIPKEDNLKKSNKLLDEYIFEHVEV